ncbi:MAG: hypothetical protein IPL32_12140 [Chloracidobacterium sp.]|nr:hypothetical protein [Chloracidobacterium sp.]
MKNRIRLILVLVFICAVGSAYGQKSKPYSEEDAKVYDGRIQQVKGTVVYLEKNDEKIPASGEYLVFQRDGCKDCLIGIHTDRDGKYKLFLGVGKYKLIVQFKNCGYAPTEDCAGYNYLAAKQPQYLVVERGPVYSGEFNIELVLPK